VHTGKVIAGSAVRDPRSSSGRGDDAAAAVAGGDVGGRDQVAVPVVPAVRAAEVAPSGLGYPAGAGGAGGGGAPLVHQPDGDRGGLGLILQGADEVPEAPVAGPLVVPPAGVEVEDAAGVADRERPDLALDGPGHDGFGGFVLGLADPPPVPGLGRALVAAVLPPAP
jgi:hypothetical protein